MKLNPENSSLYNLPSKIQINFTNNSQIESHHAKFTFRQNSHYDTDLISLFDRNGGMIVSKPQRISSVS